MLHGGNPGTLFSFSFLIYTIINKYTFSEFVDRRLCEKLSVVMLNVALQL